MSQLVLIRHGESEWNARGLFTGWVDVDLSPAGWEEARRGGELLAARGVRVDRAFTSTLRRAIDTGRIVLDLLGQPGLAQERAWQLNERYYGALTGRSKAQIADEHGQELTLQWRRSYTKPPPGGESLQDTARRTLPYVHEHVRPATEQLGCVLVSAHGNSLRAIVKELEDIADEQIALLDIPTGVPILYEVERWTVRDKQILAD